MSLRGHSEMEHQEKVDSWQRVLSSTSLNSAYLSRYKIYGKNVCGKRKKGTRASPGGTPFSQPDIISETQL